MIDTAIYTLLTTTAGVTAVCSTRSYASELPENPTLPAIRFWRVSGSGGMLYHGGVASVYESTFQFDCYAVDPLTAKQLAAAVRALFDGYSGSVGAETIIYAQVIGEQDLSDPDLGNYWVPVEVLFRHE